MDCAQAREHMHGYLDRELDAVSAASVEQHLQACTGCSSALGELGALSTALRERVPYHQAPQALAERVRASVAADARAPANVAHAKRRPVWQWLQLGAAVAAAIVATWIAALQLAGPAPDEIIAEQVIAGHARSLLTGHLADIASSDQHTVKPWLSSKLDFSPPVTDLTSAGFPLVGGRLDYVAHRPVAALVFRHRQHLLNLFVWPDAQSARASAMRAFSRRGYNLLHWDDAGMTYWAISDLNAADVRIFADSFARSR